MNYVSLSIPTTGGNLCSFDSGSCINAARNIFGIELHGSPLRINVNWLRRLQHSSYKSRCKFSVLAKIKKGKKYEYPWPDDIDPNMKSEHLSYLSSFKPLTEKPKPVTLLFEKPLVELKKKIDNVRKMANETGLDFSDQITLLEKKYEEALKELYTHLTPYQRLTIARHPHRPTFMDHVLNITEKWVELHGDRAGYDDPAIVTGLGSIDGKTYMFIGNQKGRNTKENLQRNFAMPTPHGYRKALRMMRYANHHEFPIITFIDTPGAYADLKCEELGQGEAIAHNLWESFSLKVPMVSIVIGEGGSGGALAIGCGNKLFMLENAVYYVASPEACASILWKTSAAAPKAAEYLKITATELLKLKVADEIIPEPLGGAHNDPTWTSKQIKLAVTRAMKELGEMDTDALLRHRHSKFRNTGGYVEGVPLGAMEKRKMKKTEAPVPELPDQLESEAEEITTVVKGKEKSPDLPALEQLKQDIAREMANAFIAMGLQEKHIALKADLSKSKIGKKAARQLKDRVDRFVQEFKNNLDSSSSFDGLKQKMKLFAERNKQRERMRRGELLKKEINDRLQNQAKEKMEVLRKARDSVAKGEELDENTLREVSNAKEELLKLLKSANFEVVGVNRKISSSAPPALLEQATKTNEVIFSEIAKAIDMAGLKGKLDELRSEIGKGPSKDINIVESLMKEIREGVCASLDANQLENLVKGSLGLQAHDVVGASAEQ